MFLYPDGYYVYRIIVYGIFLLRRSNGLSILVGPVSDLTLLSHYSIVITLRFGLTILVGPVSDLPC